MSAASTALLHDIPGLTREREAVTEPLAERMLDAMRSLLASAPLEVLKAAAAAQTGAGSLATLVSHLAEANPTLAAADPDAAAIARAAGEKGKLLESVPTISAAMAAQLLGMTTEGVRKKRVRHQLLAFEHGGEWRFPTFQFEPAGSVRRGVREVLTALAEIPIVGVWAQLDFLMARDAADDGSSVSGLIATGRVDEALAVVHGYGEGGA